MIVARGGRGQAIALLSEPGRTFKSIDVRISRPTGGAFVVATGSIVEIGDGVYHYLLSADDVREPGTHVLKITGGDRVVMEAFTVMEPISAESIYFTTDDIAAKRCTCPNRGPIRTCAVHGWG